MTPPLLNIKNLALTIGEKTILKDLSFALEHGCFLSIIGPNGAGKTSFIKCICRLYTHWSGSITLEETPLQELSIRQQARRISYVPQAEGRTLPFSVFEFVLMGRYPHLSPFQSISAEDRNLVQRMLSLTGMEPFAHRKLNTLSGGERQMVFIAAALAQQTDILLLDEPAAFLDYKHSAQISALLKKLNQEEGRTIITVSHDLNRACAHSTDLLALKKGSIHFFGAPSELLHVEQLESLYDTPFSLLSRPGAHPLAIANETNVQGSHP